MTDKRSDAMALDELCAASASARLLAGCWLSALGYRPSGVSDTLAHHRVSHKKRTKLVQAIRAAFACDFDAGLFPMDMPFFKSADLLGPLIPAEDATGPVIWLAGGGAGVGLGELLLAGAYAGPGRFHLLRYSKLEQIGESADWAEADVDAVIRQLPPASETSGLLLVGNSVGAHILYEVACRLEKQGRKIARLVLINSVARPRPVDMRDYDYRLYECRSPRKLIRWAQWKLASENRPVLLLWHRVLSILKWAGFAEIAYRSSLILSIAVRLKTFSYRLQHSRYSGELTLFRPSGEGAHPEQDAGWAAYCSEVEVRFFPVSRQRFLQSENRKLLVAELVRLVTESVEAPTESCLAIGKDYSAQARD